MNGIFININDSQYKRINPNFWDSLKHVWQMHIQNYFGPNTELSLIFATETMESRFDIITNWCLINLMIHWLKWLINCLNQRINMDQDFEIWWTKIMYLWLNKNLDFPKINMDFKIWINKFQVGTSLIYIIIIERYKFYGKTTRNW